MALIGTVLLWLLWILLGLLGLILAVLLIALLLPVRVWLRYDAAGFAVRLQILFFRLQLLPKKEKQSQGPLAETPSGEPQRKTADMSPKEPPQTHVPKAGEEEKAAGEKKRMPEKATAAARSGKGKQAAAPAAAKKHSNPMVRRILESLPSILDMAGAFLGAVLRSLRFIHLEVIVPVSGGAPDEVARKVGKTNAWFYAIVSPLENVLHLKWKQVRIFPDYNEEYEEQLVLAGCVRGQLLPVVIAALHLLFRLKKEKIL